MANYATLKSAIQNVVKTNGNNEITGALLQQSLLAMVDSLGAFYQFVGIAQPSTNPGTPDQNVFYLAGPGTFPNFNNTVIPDGQMAVFKYNGAWTVETLNVGKDYDEIINKISGQINGQRTDVYTNSGYNIDHGNYDFTSGAEYQFTIRSDFSGTLYFAIVDESGNVIRPAFAISSFPYTFSWVSPQNYKNAKLRIGNAGTATISVDVIYTGIVDEIQSIFTSLDRIGITPILSETISGTGFSKTINLDAGFVYRIKITSGVSGGYLALSSAFYQMFRIDNLVENTYYVPVFTDGGTPQLFIYHPQGSGTIQLTYEIWRMSAAYFVPNVNTPINYQKAKKNELDFSGWVQGYWTTEFEKTNSSSWCNSQIQFNRGRKIKIEFASNYYVRLRKYCYNSSKIEDGPRVTSGVELDTSNFGPWCIGIRHSDYTPITPSEILSNITITQIGGDVYSSVVTNEDAPILIEKIANEKISEREQEQGRNLSFGTIEFGNMVYHLGVEFNNVYVPSQSLYDIAIAKALGFKVIEANLHLCSDGVFVTKHGQSGALGRGLNFVDGSGLTEDTLFSDVSSVSLRQNVTYKSLIPIYAGGHIPTLDEFCSACAISGMIPFLRGCTPAALEIARKYLPDEKIFVDGLAERGDFKGVMTLYSTAGTADDILAACELRGRPFYYCLSNLDNLQDSFIKEVAKKLHTNGYLLGGAYLYPNKYYKLKQIGLDILVSTFYDIPYFDNGNIINIFGCSDEQLILTNASYDESLGTIEMQVGGKITVQSAKIGSFLSKISMRLRFLGTVTINYGAARINPIENYESDGTKIEEFASSIPMSGNTIVEIVANSLVTIYEIRIGASIL